MKISLRKNGLLYIFILSFSFSFLLLLLSFLFPALISSRYYEKSLKSLRSQAQLIKSEYSHILQSFNQKQKLLAQKPFPSKSSEIFDLFKKLTLKPDVEGISFYNSRGELVLWLGNVIDLPFLFQEKENSFPLQGENQSLLIQSKASFYLISLHKVPAEGYIAFYRLLAFKPQLKSPFLEDYHFLKPGLLKNCDISYWDYREDLSGFEKIFSKYKDEYIGQLRLQSKVQSIFFPLRNEQKKIVATVTLRSPPLDAYTSSQKEFFLLVFYLGLSLSLVFLLLFCLQVFFSSKEKRAWSVILFIFTLAGLRLIFFPLSNLEKVQSLIVFSPALASFLSAGNLTKSPADIFLTSLCLFLFSGCLALSIQEWMKNIKKKPPFFLAFILSLSFSAVSVFLLFAFPKILARLVFNTNINLFRFSFHLTFFLLHLSIISLFLSILLIILTGLTIASHFSPQLLRFSLVLFVSLGTLAFFLEEKGSFPLFVLQVLVLVLISAMALFQKISRRKEFLFLFFIINTLWLYSWLDTQTSERTHSLIQNSIKNTVSSQVHWANFFMEQTFPVIEKQEKLLLSFWKSSRPSPDFARSLWDKTILAKFNWYSSLEILNGEGNVLSDFSLNIPKIFLSSANFPLSQNWMTAPLTVPFLGKEKALIVGYKDWFENKNYLGRTILYLSIDYDMLPFLYSANPYFELLRVNSIPSLNEFDLGFAIFDLKGNLLFNPQGISTGISPDLLHRVQFSSRPIWSAFIDKNKKYHSLYFRHNERLYALFTPQKTFIAKSIEFFKLFFFYFFLLFIPVFLYYLAFSPKRYRHLLWSFSNRVYVSFIAVALIPLFLFTFFTRSFFSRIFSQQFIDKAEIQANFARRVMDDFIFFQQEERPGLLSLPEDLVLWISTTLSNDVNLYENGKLISSSRREFFDSGLLPELMDGEIYYKIQYENNPFYAQIRKIGKFYFRTLTIPYTSFGPLLLLSLPFPLEQQEISQATEELIEFLFFISVFFIATVLILARGIGAMIIHPIQKLLAGTKEASLGNLEISIDYRPKDEMKTLVDGFNAMIKNLKKHQQELAEMGKKVAWAEMARKVAHEVKNPLTPIQLSAEHILKVYEDKKADFDQALKESISYIINEVENLRKIAQEFLEFSKEPVLHKEFFDVKELVKETADPYKKLLAARIQFKESYKGEDFRFEGDKSKIKIALRNLLTNAIESIRGKGEIRIQVSQKIEEIVVEIEDTGIGIEKDHLERIFEPYFSTKDVGTGLGLPIAKKIIEDHQGSIHIVSEPKKGTSIAIRLPLPKT